MIRVGLVDDETYDLEKLQNFMATFDEIKIQFATQSAEEAYREIQKKEVDLLLCDIEMPDLSGFELAHYIHRYALHTSVIFVTAHSGYAVHAFEIAVHDYIMKPYTEERLRKSIRRFIENQKREEENHGLLPVKQQSEIHFIKKKEILFLERTGRSSTIVTEAEQFETYQTLNVLEAQLKERHFFRSHRSFIINIHHVKNFSYYTKHSYLVTFDRTNKTALMTKEKLKAFQQLFF